MSALSLNNVVLCGRMTADPELKTTQNGKSVMSFTVAVPRPRISKDKDPGTDFINCVAWNKNAENITRFFKKGMSIYLEGMLMQRRFEDSEGKGHTVYEVVISTFHFVDNLTTTLPQGNEVTHAAATAEGVPEGFVPVGDNESLPF